MSFWKWIMSILTRPSMASAEGSGPIVVTPKSEAQNHDDPPWLKAAIGEIGVKEMNGTLHHPRIIEYHMTTTLKKREAESDETPWCASFVNWCMEQAGRKGTDSAWARSWLKFGDPLDVPRRGCIVVFSRGETSGHVGFFIKQIGDKILVLSGNQNNMVCEAFYPKSRLLGYRWPKGRE